MKVVNAADSVYSTTICVDGAEEIAKSGKIISLTASSAKDENSYEEPRKIYPHESDYGGFGKKFDFDFHHFHIQC